MARFASSARRRASSELALACSSSPKIASFSACDCSASTVDGVDAPRQAQEEHLRADHHGHEHHRVHVLRERRGATGRRRIRGTRAATAAAGRVAASIAAMAAAAMTRPKSTKVRAPEARPPAPSSPRPCSAGTRSAMKALPPAPHRDRIRRVPEEMLGQSHREADAADQADGPGQGDGNRHPQGGRPGDDEAQNGMGQPGPRAVLGVDPEQLVIEGAFEPVRRGQPLACRTDVSGHFAAANGFRCRRTASTLNHLRCQVRHHRLGDLARENGGRKDLGLSVQRQGQGAPDTLRTACRDPNTCL